MKKIWSRILVIFMVMVTIFQVAVPPELCFVDSVVYAEDKVSWWDKFKKAAGEIALNGLNLLIHQIPGSDAIMEAVRTALKGTEWEGVVEYLTMKEYIPDHTAWYRPLITSAADANGVTDFINSAYNHLTDDTGEKSDLFIYYYNSSGEQAYPDFKREISFNIGTSLTSQKVYLVKGTVYYIPRYMFLRITRDSILETLEALAANLIYSLANGLHFLTACALGTSVTIDDLVFNNYAETDISFFEKQSGNSGSSLIYGKNGVGGLDNVITQWYAIFQKIALMAYMAILVYMGIKIMLGSTAGQKANYKQLFVDWVIGLAILLLFPYAMKYTIKMNEAFVKTIEANKGYVTQTSAPIKNIDTSKDFDKASIDDIIDWENGNDYMSQIGFAAYQSEKIALSVAFLIMTWQLIALIFHYYKRLFMIAFLIIIFPLVALSYAIDKIADGKSQAFNTWFKEYFLNVFIQSFHAIVYVFVCSTIYAASGTTAGGYDYILIIVGVTFLFKGEQIIKEIFGQTSAAGTMKTLADTAAGAYLKIDLARRGLEATASYTFGQKSVARKIGRGVNNLKAINSRINAFEATSEPNKPMDTGLRLEHAPEKPPENATPEQKTNFAENIKKFNAAAVLNNPNSHSYEEKARAQDTLKNLAEEDPNNDVFKDTKTTVGQFRALNQLDKDVQRMIMAGQDPLEIERNITARMAMIFPNEKGKQLEDRTNTYLTGLFLNGAGEPVVKPNRPELKNQVEETLKAIKREEESINFGHNNRRSKRELELETEQMYLDAIEGKEDELSDDEKEDIRKLTKEIYILNRRKYGEYTKLELLDVVDDVRKHAYDNEITQKLLEENLDSELDIDALAHIMAKTDIGDKAGKKDSNHYRVATEIKSDYESNPREGYFDDEISIHELIKYKDNPEELEKIIDRTVSKTEETANNIKGEVNETAKEILAKRRVDILKNSYDTETPLQEGYTRDEVLAMRVGAINDMLDDLSPFKKSSDETSTSFLDLYTKYTILKNEEERSGVSRRFLERLEAMEPKAKPKNRYDFNTEILMNTDDFIEHRAKERAKIKNKHFTGDIDTNKK